MVSLLDQMMLMCVLCDANAATPAARLKRDNLLIKEPKGWIP